MDSKSVTENTRIGIAVVSASCCMPGLAALEEKAQRIIAQAVSETGIDAVIKTLPISSYYHSLPKEIVGKWLADYNQGKISAPAILIDGKVAFYGVLGLEDMKNSLIKAAAARGMKENKTR